MANKTATFYGKQDCRKLCKDTLAASNLAEACEVLEREASRLESLAIERNEPTKAGDKLVGMVWADTFRKLASGLRDGQAPFTVFAKGNSKLPFYSYSEVPEFTCPGAGECLNFCYSFTAWRYPAAFARQLQNTLLMRFKRSIIAREFNAIRAKKGQTEIVVRLYVDGDIADIGVLSFWFGLLNRRPDVKAYGYSKSWEVFKAYADQGLRWPENYVLNLSSGSKYGAELRDELATYDVTRGEFIAVPIPAGTFAKGFKRFEDKSYHAAIRQAGREVTGQTATFSCPGTCGTCLPSGKHACGQRDLVMPIIIGEHN